MQYPIFIYYIYYYLYTFFLYIKSLFIKSVLPSKPHIDQTQRYLLDKHAYFDRNKTSSHSQIEPFFYNKETYATIMNDHANPYEKQWKTRILFENTPRGNIIMLYDIYKMGFLYYSDQQSIPYNILNAVAMKYVITFHCLDFFMDETHYTSPFLKLYEKNKTHINNIKKTIQITTSVRPSTPLSQPVETIKNRFLYQGKIMNFSFLQKTPKIPAINISNKYNGLFDTTTAYNMSYKDFKTKVLLKDRENSLSK
jgi:hypothetical protein